MSARNGGYCRIFIDSCASGVCLSVCLTLTVCLTDSVCLCVCLSVCLFACLSICLSVYVCLSVCLPICLSVYLSVSLCLSVCMSGSVCLSVYIQWCLSQDFHDVHAFQAFNRYDVTKAGHITALQFHDIMISLKGHLLTNFVRENLVSVRRAIICSLYPRNSPFGTQHCPQQVHGGGGWNLISDKCLLLPFYLGTPVFLALC